MSWAEERNQIQAARPARVLVVHEDSYYQRNKPKQQEYARQYLKIEANFKQSLLNGAKHRATTKSRDFDLTVEDIVWPTHCPVFGHKFVYAGGGDRRTSPSLDRIDSSRGYTQDNVQVISTLANIMKRDATENELRRFASWILA